MEDYEDLTYAGFFGRIDLPDHLTNRVLQAMKDRGIANKDLAAGIYEPMGLGVPGSAEVFINKIRSKRSYQKLPSAFSRSENERKKRQLYRISVLLHALEIENSDPLVQRLKHIYKGFQYPPRQQ